MIKNSLLTALLVMLLSLIFAGLAVWQTNLTYPKRSGGTLVWANTAQPDRIAITTAGTEITLQLENNLWTVKQADFYYANSELVNQLFENFRTSIYQTQQPFSPAALEADDLTSEAGTTITTYAGSQELNSIMIGKRSDNGLYHFARTAQGDQIWLIDGRYNLPKVVYSWLIQPLFSYPDNLIEQITITTNGTTQTAIRQESNLPFFIHEKPAIGINALVERFNFFIAEKVVAAQNFDDTAYSGRRQIAITTFSGLVTTLDLHYNTQEYWLKISLSAAPLSSTGVNAYIRDNSFLYDGWYFQIPAAIGKLLSEYEIR